MAKEIPILLYHNIGDYPEELMEDGLNPGAFRSQMQYLSQNGLQVVPLEMAANHIARLESVSENALSITFDGGYRDAVKNVWPILKEFGFTATFFIIPDAIGGRRKIKNGEIDCMGWEDVKALMENGMEIGILAYQGRSIKNGYNEEAVRDSLEKDLKIFSKHVGTRPHYCAFKEGTPGKRLWAFVQNAGFKAVLTQCPTNKRVGLDGIGRIQVDDDDQNIFLTKISKTYLFFKDKRSWKYIRKFSLDYLAHRISEGINQLRNGR